MEEKQREICRRHITVLFCDLVGSTKLSERLDPEELMVVFEKYRDICVRPISRHNGKVVKFLGDGIVSCFGYPNPLDNSAEAAANAALEIQKNLDNTLWAKLPGSPLMVRIGIHSGEVVAGGYVGESGESEADSIVGVIPNIASRIQGLAEPGQIMTSQSTRKLIGRYFETELAGDFEIRGVSQPMELFRLVGAKPLADQAKRIDLSGSPPLIGRSTALKKLERHWNAAKRGESRVVQLVGEAGVGKTRLVAELKSKVEEDGQSIWDIQCSPYHRNTAFFAILDFLQRSLSISGDDSSDEIARRIGRFLEKFALRSDAAVGLLTAVFDPAVTDGLTPGARKEQTLDLIHSIFLNAAERNPIMVEFADIHWIDPSSLAVLKRLVADRFESLLIVFSHRPGVSLGWLKSYEFDVDRIKLSGLVPALTRDLAQSTAGGKSLPKEVADWIHRNTGGIPLYIEELTRALIESGSLVEQGDFYDIGSWSDDEKAPGALQDLLLLRLEQLGPSKRLAQMAAIIGPVFSCELLEFLWKDAGGETSAFHENLQSLIDADIVMHSEAGGGWDFSFRHALIQKAAYDSTLRTTRQELHRRLADFFMCHPVAQKSNKPALVARHLQAGGRAKEALPFWIEAASDSLRRSAHAECVALANRSLETVRKLADSEGNRESELTLTSLKFFSLITLRGYSSEEVESCALRLENLGSAEKKPTAKSFTAFFGLWTFHLMRGNLRDCRSIGSRLREIAGDLDEFGLQREGAWATGATSFWIGDLPEAFEQLEIASGFDFELEGENSFLLGQNGAVASRVYLSLVHCYRGDAEGAEEIYCEALDLAEQLEHPATMAMALGGGTMLRLILGDFRGAVESGWAAIRYCQEQMRAYWLIATRMMVGWAMVQLGEEEGISMFEEAFADFEVRGNRLGLPGFLGMLAECKAIRGDVEGAFDCIERGLVAAAQQNENISTPDLLVLKARIILTCEFSNHEEVEHLFRKAIRMAAEQGADLRKSRATAELVGFLRSQHRIEEADHLTTPLVDWIKRDGRERIVDLAKFTVIAEA